MSKDNKNKENKMPAVLKTLLSIFLIALITYAVMAIITHFSLNFETETYKFKKSIDSIFNTSTAIFKFFTVFMLVNISWIIIAVLIHYIKRIFIK
ncbi:MAG: hypothetical protein L3J35_05285 [Bacteroidales bacterium]|nr:hypothetical protein [Bacteroidales bacterium]